MIASASQSAEFAAAAAITSKDSAIPNVEIAALCDIDENVSAKRVAEIEKFGAPTPKTYCDVRKLLENKEIDAISIATPNHWHSLMAIWGCQAGKDVYVEKPCSHNTFEGRQLVKAVKKYNRICQHGSQSRSNPGMIEAIKRTHDGTIGDTYLARALCYKWRDTIGHAEPEAVPAGVHYDLWTGPAPMKPFTKIAFTTIGIGFGTPATANCGNQAIHEIDIARWGLGVDWPTSVSAQGGHFMFEDDQETPNVLAATFYFGGEGSKRKMMELEVRHWHTNHEAEIGTGAYKSAGVPAAGLEIPPPAAAAPAAKKPATPGAALGPKDAKSNTVGNIFYGTKGYLGIDGVRLLQNLARRRSHRRPSGKGSADHYQNFIDCVRSRKAEDIHSPIEEAHKSTTLVHLANASYRLGRTMHFDAAKEEVINDPEANAMLRGTYRAPYVVTENM